MVSGGSLRNTLGHGSATSRTLCTSSCNLADAATPRTLLELESPSSVGVSQAATEPELRPPGTPPYPFALVQTMARSSEQRLCLRSSSCRLLLKRPQSGELAKILRKPKY